MAGAAYMMHQATRYSFAGKVVLITGGSRGLGLVLARHLAAEGARVAICARSSNELQRAEQDLLRLTPHVLALPCDVTQRNQVEQMVEAIGQHWGAVDVLINNAGVIRVGPVETMTEEDFRQAMDTHFWGALNTALAVMPDMRRRRRGRIVNISSIGGEVAVPHLVPYCASKFAVVGLSQGLRVELARYGIKVTTICPGLMRTGSPPQAEFKGRHRAEYAWFNISGSMPGASMSVERAARQIIEACRSGRAHVTLSLPAKAAALSNAVMPGVTSAALALVNRLLPRPGGVDTAYRKGYESRSSWSPSLLTALTQRAARRNNELGGR